MPFAFYKKLGGFTAVPTADADEGDVKNKKRIEVSCQHEYKKYKWYTDCGADCI